MKCVSHVLRIILVTLLLSGCVQEPEQQTTATKDKSDIQVFQDHDALLKTWELVEFGDEHADHYGGTQRWDEHGAELIAHWEFLHNQQYLKDLLPYLMPRNYIFYPHDIPKLPKSGYGLIQRFYPVLEPDVIIDDGGEYAFEVGGTKFVVYSMPGAEGSDGLTVWLPEERILFTGDLYGHIFGMWPNLTTMRGERPRYPRPYIESLNRVLELEPEILVPSHFYPIKGKAFIKALTTKTRDAVAYVDNAVIEGMNEGKDVYTLMKEITLPEELQLNEVHGKVSWAVRSIWEAYTGWFYHNSATEMYAVPVTDAYPDLYEVAGGTEPLLTKAKALFAQRALEKSLHLTEVVLEIEADHKGALSLKRDILKALLERSGGVNHHEKNMLAYWIAEVEGRL